MVVLLVSAGSTSISTSRAISSGDVVSAVRLLEGRTGAELLGVVSVGSAAGKRVVNSGAGAEVPGVANRSSPVDKNVVN